MGNNDTFRLVHSILYNVIIYRRVLPKWAVRCGKNEPHVLELGRPDPVLANKRRPENWTDENGHLTRTLSNDVDDRPFLTYFGSIINDFLAIKTLLNYKLDDANSEKSLSNQLYEVTIIFKSFGRNMNHEQKHFIGQLFLQFIRKQILNGDFTFDDGRSAVIHILDAFYRADAQEYWFFLFIDCSQFLVNSWPTKNGHLAT